MAKEDLCRQQKKIPTSVACSFCGRYTGDFCPLPQNQTSFSFTSSQLKFQGFYLSSLTLTEELCGKAERMSYELGDTW